MLVQRGQTLASADWRRSSALSWSPVMARAARSRAGRRAATYSAKSSSAGAASSVSITAASAPAVTGEQQPERGDGQPERAHHAGHVLQRADREHGGQATEQQARDADPAGVGAVPAGRRPRPTRAVRPTAPQSHGMVPIQCPKKAAASGTIRSGSLTPKTNSVVSPAPMTWTAATRSSPREATDGSRLSAPTRWISWRRRPAAKTTRAAPRPSSRRGRRGSAAPSRTADR